MDKSETYIKMCEKAEKIRVLWKPADWDYCYCKKNKEVAVLSGYDTDAGFYGHSAPAFSNPFGGKLYWHDFFCSGIDTLEEYKEQHIWLPTQSQLQEMVKLNKNEYSHHLKKSEAHRLLFEFYPFCIEEIGYSLGNVIDATSDTRQFTSMEQLWLAFVQKELYGLIWNGEDWVKGE